MPAETGQQLRSGISIDMRCTLVSHANNRLESRNRRSKNPLRTILIISLTGLVGLGALYVTVDRTSKRVTHQAERPLSIVPRVSLLSARRAPNTLSVITRTQRVSRAFTNMVADIPSQSCAAVEWMGLRLASLNSDKAYVPASSTKLITAAVALEILKPTFSFTTSVHGSIDSLGGVNDLYFVGGGDPLLVRSEYVASEKYPTTSGTSLEKLADSLVAAGLKQVSGSIVGVDSRYDDKRFVDIWPQSFRFSEAGPLGSLVVDDGVVIGQPMKPDDPAIGAVIELQTLLTTRGVVVIGMPRHDVMASELPVIASIQSSALSLIVQEMLVNSDNNTAELLLKEIGLSAKGTGSTAAGLTVVLEQLSRWKAGTNVQLYDGSGLAVENRIPCDVFMTLLKTFSSSLPGLMATAGETGTIRDTFKGTPVDGQLRGKTGTLNGVKALVGYLAIKDSDSVTFSILMNKTGVDNQGIYRPIWYALAEVLNKASAHPSVEQLTP